MHNQPHTAERINSLLFRLDTASARWLMIREKAMLRSNGLPPHRPSPLSSCCIRHMPCQLSLGLHIQMHSTDLASAFFRT